MMKVATPLDAEEWLFLVAIEVGMFSVQWSKGRLENRLIEKNLDFLMGFMALQEKVSVMELSESTTIRHPLTADERNARTRSASVLLTVESFELSSNLLDYHVHNNSSVELFLRLMGIIWRSNSYPLYINICQCLWNVALRVGLLLFLGYCIFLLGSTFTKKNSLVNKVFAVTLLLQCVTLLFALYDMHRRLSSKVSNHYILHLTKGLKSAYLVLCLSCIIAAIPCFLFTIVAFPHEFVMAYLWGEISMSCFLTATMYFISTDCAVALSLLSQLMEHEKMQVLTIEQYSLVQREVEVHQASSQWINNSIIIVAILDIVSVLLTLLTSEKQGFANFGVYSVMFYLAFLLKEIPFVCVVYWQVAQVNEKFSSFLKRLSIVTWTHEFCLDHRRLALYIRAQGQPVSIALAGMKLKRRDLAWQFALWLFAFAVSSVRAAVLNNA